jgi:DNA polymerase-4
LDAFYASVEALEDPSLRNKPLIVGGDGRRGVVASCSYEARFFGVRSAMPSVRAKRLCPQAIFVSGHYDLYEQYSKRMHRIFQTYTPDIEPISLDEAFLDVTGVQRLFGPAPKIAHMIRERIRDEVGLVASVGVATTKHVAKLASEAAKPKAAKNGPVPGRGVFVVREHEAIDFLHSLPVRALWGVGPATADRLASLGVEKVGQLAKLPVKVIASSLGQSAARHLHDLAWNRDDRPVVSSREAKSIGHEQTFPYDLKTSEEVHAKLIRLVDATINRMRKAKSAGRTVTVKIRFGDFRTITRSKTLPAASAHPQTILKLVEEAMAAVDVTDGVRLLGVSMSNLEPLIEVEQMALTEGVVDADTSLDDAIDRIRDRFGDGSVVPAPLVGPSGEGAFKWGERQWGPTENGEQTTGRARRDETG